MNWNQTDERDMSDDTWRQSDDEVFMTEASTLLEDNSIAFN